MKKYLAYYENEWPANIAELTAVENKPFVGYLKGKGMSFTVVPKLQPNNEIWFKANQTMVESDITAAYTNANVIGLKHEDDWYKIVYDDVVTSIDWANWENPGVLGSKMTEISLPNNVTSIGHSAFGGCYSLISINIPESVTEIGINAFANCRSLTSITIPNGVTSIGWTAFSGCSSLTSVTIPESVTEIEGYAFSGCLFTKDDFINNSSLDAEANNYWGATVYDYKMNGVLVKDNVAIKGDRDATSVVIPDGVTSIGKEAFWHCSSLTSVTIPNSVTNIGRSAFCGCSFTSITIPNGVTSIGEYAFSDCSSLTSVTIPNSVTNIGDYIFDNCTSLVSITFEGTKEEWDAIDKSYYRWAG
jgi:hypothetical protein